MDKTYKASMTTEEKCSLLEEKIKNAIGKKIQGAVIVSPGYKSNEIKGFSITYLGETYFCPTPIEQVDLDDESYSEHFSLL
jgi:hypothetical protein